MSCQVGAYVHRVVANDPDIAPILRYRVDHNSSEARNEEGTLIKIQEYDYLAALELNAIDGLLRVVKLLDRERVETIRLGLVVEDLAAVKGLQTASGLLIKPFYDITLFSIQIYNIANAYFSCIEYNHRRRKR